MNASYLLASVALILTASAAGSLDAAPDRLAGGERRLGFETIFDGRSFDGWQREGEWVLEDGALFSGDDGALIYYVGRVMPDDFELRFEWKVSKGANGGLLYRPGQYEYQVLDNVNNQHGVSPRTGAGSLFFCMPPSRDVTRPFGEWNEGRIVCKGSVIQHWVNGEKVIDFDYTDPRWARELEMFRIRCFRPPYGGDLAARGGFLRLQNHGQQVWYRNLRLRAIPPSEELARSPFEPMPIPPAGRKYEKGRVERVLRAVKPDVVRMEELLREME